MKKYKSEIYEVIHQDALANFEVGAISKARLREYEKFCFVEESESVYEAEDPKKIEKVPVTA